MNAATPTRRNHPRAHLLASLRALAPGATTRIEIGGHGYRREVARIRAAAYEVGGLETKRAGPRELLVTRVQ